MLVKTGMDVAKHHGTECYIRSTHKHKYTCLNNTCLLHSWICIEHSKENRPLIEAHHKEATKAKQTLPFLRPTTYTCEAHPKDLPTPVPPAVRSYNKPRVVDAASDSENSGKIQPT